MYDDGFWRRIEGRYERVRWGSEVWSGCAGVDRDVFPGYWERPRASVAFPPDFTMRLSSNGADGVLSEGDRCTLVKLAEEGTHQAGSAWTPRFRTVESGFTYLVLEGSAYSRFPPGMTWCGSGVETELLWLKLDASLAVVAHDTARVESCLDAIEAEVHQLGGPGLTIVAAQSTEGKVTSRTRISYDAWHPAAGLVKQPIENKTEN